MKRIARLPSKDRQDVLCALRRNVKKRRGELVASKTKVMYNEGYSTPSDSQSSIKFNEQVAIDDVWGIGKAVGLKFNGDKNNLFDVLSREGRKNKVRGGIEK